jgi:hypothetical protein
MNIKPNQKSKNNDCKLLRLVSGEFIISKIVGSTKDEFFLERPMTITGFTSMGSVGELGMIQKQYMCLNNWMEYSIENTVKIRKNFVMAMSKPEQKVMEAYELQKEVEDTDTSFIDKYKKLQISENTLDDCDDITSQLTEEQLGRLMQNIMEDLESMESDENSVEYDEDDTRPDYGMRWQDWSPYTEDYIDDEDLDSLR